MRYPASEKLEIIRLFEEFALSVRYEAIKVNMRPKPLTSAQIRAARALLHWSAEDLARKISLERPH